MIKDLHIYNAVKGYLKKSRIRLHMPGHKGKRILGVSGRADVTELPAIENEKAVLLAEKDCARILGVKQVFFLTGGATVGVLAAIFAVKDFCKKIVIVRSSHKSVYNACELFNIEPIILDELNKETLERAFLKEGAGAALITSPDYYGRIADLAGIKEVCIKYGKKLIVDGAHGNAFLYLGLPYSGAFADVCVEGLHKTNFTFNQGAIVSVNDESLTEKVKKGVGVFSTTSPSYVLLSSIEYGIKYYAAHKKDLIKKASVISRAKDKLINAGLKVMSAEDPFKITLLTGESGFSGKDLANALAKKGIYPELYGEDRVLFMFSAANTVGEIGRFCKAVLNAARRLDKKEVKSEKPISHRIGLSYLAAVNAESELTPLFMAAGKVCAENFGKFPPCSPACVAGEIIEPSDVEDLYGDAFGVYDGKVKTVKAVKDE